MRHLEGHDALKPGRRSLEEVRKCNLRCVPCECERGFVILLNRLDLSVNHCAAELDCVGSYFDKFPIESIQPRPFRNDEMKQAPMAAYSSRIPNYGMNEMQCREAIRAYYASSAFMDAQVGRVLSELKRLGLEKETIVVFWADHGWSLGEHGQWEKQTLFESSLHVPLIFSGPGIGTAKVCHRTVEHLDIYPTLAELCELHTVPFELDGTSLAPLLRNANAAWNKPAISEVTRPPAPNPKTIGYSLRTERYRYTVWQGADTGEELYDYAADPHETSNIAHRPEMQETRDSLRIQLEAITSRRGRTLALGMKVVEKVSNDTSDQMGDS